MLFSEARIAVFAKAPVEGQVKTRLIPRIGAANSAQLHREMTIQVLQTATESDLCSVDLWCYPDTSHEFFQHMAQRFQVTLYAQQGSNLGQKMFNAAAHTLQRASQVIIIGSDCLQFTTQHLQQAILSIAMQDNRVVLTPAYDGGYVLIGMNHVDRLLFKDVSWGAAEVLAQTRRNLQQLEWNWYEMPCLHDIDIESDLKDIDTYATQYPLNPELSSLLQNILATL
ncbi:TIGR04282 family arsenosugar biosynthesis glycosyltransferase [Kaarinaea lacus]